MRIYSHRQNLRIMHNDLCTDIVGAFCVFGDTSQGYFPKTIIACIIKSSVLIRK